MKSVRFSEELDGGDRYAEDREFALSNEVKCRQVFTAVEHMLHPKYMALL